MVRSRTTVGVLIGDDAPMLEVAVAPRVFGFDHTARGGPRFDVRVAGGCARFDLYIDGKHHPDKVRMGPRAHRPPKVPFDRCP